MKINNTTIIVGFVMLILISGCTQQVSENGILDANNETQVKESVDKDVSIVKANETVMNETYVVNNTPNTTNVSISENVSEVVETNKTEASFSCGDSYTFFSTSPVGLATVSAIVPMGEVRPIANVFPAPYISYGIRQTSAGVATSPTINVLVFSPGNVTVKLIRVIEHASVKPAYKDYEIYFSPCEELTAYFL
ncbi:hypothetical protein HY570_03435, partial [Candidatus Micrarchaeota archaeon]|nr:hypothetical protein [Candidatus Micrarchaeota archaeon]